MRVLALDSTSRAGSLAIVDEDRMLFERPGDEARTHAERLPGDITSSGVALSSIDLFAVVCGPGSFTGLRVGIATVQGLAFALSKRVVAVSALEILGQIGSRDLPAGTIVGAWIDAHRREVFSALYVIAEAPVYSAARIIELDPPSVGPPAQVLERWSALGRPPAWLIGDGATAYAGVVSSQIHVAATPPLAGALGLIAAQRAKAGQTVDPAGIQPLYIRRPDAEIDRERRLRLEARETAGKPRGTQS
jgi:tRNA threonylcarbamoyladenosine biosynthesis protein TsaB